ncbi:lytic transglycosylase domain-containing protein [Shewanella sp. BF02_Schw]|uniref:lytic transglycosylase domain-containing protein n=1 Tax=Shewanella sp. BF02_Schw TaxID=394908 RepID=UPI001784B4D9|nr:lytic transglycosylase domain-containing protein [Shewanella sp. BF02_Schw]MBO1897651.1 lytic transglycosylase domain-containing protein [Shewanella sp. BF02_Schw]
MLISAFSKVTLSFGLCAILFFSVPVSANANSAHPVRDMLYKQTALKKYEKFKNCIFWQSKNFNVNELVLMSVLLAEHGNEDSKIKNQNKTYDYGLMQINDARTDELVALGYDLNEVRTDGCKNIEAATHIISLEIERAGDVWLGVGRYHYNENGKYPKHHYKYRARVNKKLDSLLKVAKRSLRLMHLSSGQ